MAEETADNETQDWRSAPRGDDAAREWVEERARYFGLAVKRFRRALGLSAVELSNRTKEIGYPITRSTVARIEGNHRKGKIDLAEVMALAAALEVAPLDLVFVGGPRSLYRTLPRISMSNEQSAAWFSGSHGYDQWAELHRPRLTQSERLEKALEDYYQALDSFESRRVYQLDNKPGEWFISDPEAPHEKGLRAFSEQVSAERKVIWELRKRVQEVGGDVEPPAWWENYEVMPF